MATINIVRVAIVNAKYGIVLSDITPQIVRTTIGSAMATSDIGYLGFGQQGIFGTGANACLINAGGGGGSTSAKFPSVDPPVVYTFCNATQPYGRDFLNLNLKMIRANDYSFNIQVVLNGNPLNCTGGFLRMTAKWNATDTDPNEVFSVTSPSGGIIWINQSLGQANITIASALTNTGSIPFHRIDLPYDIEFTDFNGKRYTVAYGTLTVLPNISQTSP